MSLKYNSELTPRSGWLGLQTWVILVGHAMHGKILTYGRLSELLGHPVQFLGKNALEPVAAWCLEYKLPPLTAIVVRQEDARPGDGFPDDPGRLIEVLLHEWHRYTPPSADELFRLAHERGQW